MSFQAGDADRRIETIASIGVVTSVNTAAATVRVQIGDLGTAEIPVMQLSAGGKQFWWMPTVGEQVAVLAPGGDMARAIMIGSIYAGNAPSSDGAEPRINLAGGHMVIDGDVTITGKVIIQGTTDLESIVTMGSDLQIDGDANCDGDVVASGVSLETHTHGGVSSGGSSTGGPQ